MQPLITLEEIVGIFYIVWVVHFIFLLAEQKVRYEIKRCLKSVYYISLSASRLTPSLV